MQLLTPTHLRRLTDNFSIWQHTRGLEVDREMGYSLDDGARALLAALAYDQLDLAEIYLSFLETACGGPDIVNFFGPDRNPLNKPWSNDALGESFWALGACVKYNFQPARARQLMKTVTPLVSEFNFLRGQAYAILGAIPVDPELVKKFVENILQAYHHNALPGWEWPEDRLIYGNAILPYALLEGSEMLENTEGTSTALAMLDFLNKETKEDGVPIAIGNKGWYVRGEAKALFDQQPIDPAYQVLANVAAWDHTQNKKYLGEARAYFDWFWGNNLLNTPLVDPVSGCVFDGMNEQGVSPNCGSENITCYLIAQKAICSSPIRDE